MVWLHRQKSTVAEAREPPDHIITPPFKPIKRTHKSLPKSPRVSVILTVNNRTNYLAEALESALSQSYKDFEIIVADDSGTAASRAITASCSQPERVRYRPNPATFGVVRSLIGAIEAASAELIAILNDDDVWEEDLDRTGHSL
jgi:glycosyltransferase involved in cell wall biosynthesis